MIDVKNLDVLAVIQTPLESANNSMHVVIIALIIMITIIGVGTFFLNKK